MTASKMARTAHRVTRAEAGTRLDLLVGAWLARDLERALSKSVVRKLIVAGVVRMNGRRIRRPAAAVHAGAQLEATVDLAMLNARRAGADDAGSTATPDVLYEDDDLIAVAKPAGIIMHATADPARPDLFTTVRRMLADRHRILPVGPSLWPLDTARGDPAALEGSKDGRLPYLALHHRLDVETSGVVLFAKREEANAGLAKQFAGGKVAKVYHAIARQPSAPTRDAWRVENRLAPGGSGRRARVHASATGARAATDFTILERLGEAVLVEARPGTGRKHQIRAHLAGSHAPIFGDSRYGGPMKWGPCSARRVMLHSLRLSLRHPTTDAPLTIACPYPADFDALLACLRQSPRRHP